jgi:enolase
MSENNFRIEKVFGREILDSRGNPTVQVDITTPSGFGRFSVPSGASKGRFEAVELRDNDRQRYHGKGVLKAVDNVNHILARKIVGLDSRNQEEVDRVLIDLDGSPDKSRLGANALLGVSIATAKSAADSQRIPFYKYLRFKQPHPVLPMPMMNILNGGKHAGNDLAFQEFMVLPAGFKSFHGALRCGVEIYQSLKERLESKYGRSAVNVGDEGGFAPPIENIEEALGNVSDSVEEAGYELGRNVVLGIDPAPDNFYDPDKDVYRVNGKEMTSDQLLGYYQLLLESYALKSIEDPFHDESFDYYAKITKTNSRVQIVGDDLYVTNTKRLEKGIRLKAGNALLVKPNQVGTLTETIEAIEKARSAEFGLVMSHRSGETEDHAIADLAVGLSTGQIKAGAPARGERTVKYNRLIEVEQELGTEASYYGPEFLKHHE